MEKLWSIFWKSSSQKRKQKKYAINAPLHIKHRLVNATLSKELRKQYNTRSVPVRTGDTVKLATGQFKGKTGKVTKVSLARMKIFIDGITIKRMDGTDAMYPVHPSNLIIIKLDLSDKKRAEKMERLKNNE